VGIEQDAARAVAWIARAAVSDSADAQYLLGTLYMDGIGVTRDYYAAMEWFFRAAHQGISDAQYQVGVMYAQGLGVMRRESTAEAWLRKAAAGGHELARRELAELTSRRVRKLGNYPLPDLRRVRGSLYG
jgi:TPR repeat protein